MKSLKPITILVAGPLMVAVAFTMVATIVQPNMRNARGIIIWLVVGAVLGLFIFGPIAAGESVHARFVRRHFQRFERWSAMLGAMGLGYLLGRGIGDTGILIAGAVVFLCACFRVFLSGIARQPAA